MHAHHAFWPSRLPHSITPPPPRCGTTWPSAHCATPTNQPWCFLAVRSATGTGARGERLAAQLHALGVQRGDRVVLCMQNCPQLVLAHFAILRANAVVVPVNPMNRAEELKHYITDPDARVAITTADLAPSWPRRAMPCLQGRG